MAGAVCSLSLSLTLTHSLIFLPLLYVVLPATSLEREEASGWLAGWLVWAGRSPDGRTTT